MTELYCYSAEDGRLLSRDEDRDRIAERLADLNVRYAWLDLPPVTLDDQAEQDEVIEAFRLPLDTLMQEDSFSGLDVLAVRPGDPDQAAWHRELMTEHAHAGIEGHLLIEGEGLFFLRGGERIHALRCQAGDFILVPAGLGHWFDMGATPCLRSIRFYASMREIDDVVSGSDMRGAFPSLEHCDTRVASRPSVFR